MLSSRHGHLPNILKPKHFILHVIYTTILLIVLANKLQTSVKAKNQISIEMISFYRLIQMDTNFDKGQANLSKSWGSSVLCVWLLSTLVKLINFNSKIILSVVDPAGNSWTIKIRQFMLRTDSLDVNHQYLEYFLQICNTDLKAYFMNIQYKIWCQQWLII